MATSATGRRQRLPDSLCGGSRTVRREQESRRESDDSGVELIFADAIARDLRPPETLKECFYGISLEECTTSMSSLSQGDRSPWTYGRAKRRLSAASASP